MFGDVAVCYERSIAVMVHTSITQCLQEKSVVTIAPNVAALPKVYVDVPALIEHEDGGFLSLEEAPIEPLWKYAEEDQFSRDLNAVWSVPMDSFFVFCKGVAHQTVLCGIVHELLPVSKLCHVLENVPSRASLI